MKKLLVLGLALGMMVMGSVMVFADETEIFESNMTPEYYLELRLGQIQKSLDNGLISDEEADLLIAHIKEVADAGTFGYGPTFGVKGDGNATCILGEDSNLGIFRSESAGMRTGEGNGMKQQLKDGSGTRGQGNRGVSRGQVNLDN